MCGFSLDTPTRTIDQIMHYAESQGDRYQATLLYNERGDRALLLTEDDGWQFAYTDNGQGYRSFEPQQASCTATRAEKQAAKDAATKYLSEKGYTLAEPPVKEALLAKAE